MSDPSNPQPPVPQPPQQPAQPPPLSAPMAPPLAQGYAPPAPPQPQFYAPPAPPAHGTWLAPAPAPQKRPGWLLPVAIGGSIAVIGAMLAATVFLVLPAAFNAAPWSSASQSAGDGSIAEDADGRRIFGPDDPVLEGDGTITEQLEVLKDTYQAQFDDGSLWELMPKTKENLGAYQAFQMLITDMKGATLFGTSAEDNLYFSQEARYLEARFLAEEPLGSNVTYTNSEGRTFKYNGDTGEVSYE